MATAGSPQSPPADAAGEQPKKITFRFCRECSNLLYPKENRETNELRFECRTCRWDEEAPSSCVYRNQMSNAVGATAGITQDIGQDPTVGAPVESAAHSAATARDFFVPSPPLSPIPDFCTMCGNEIYCETCGQPTDYGCFLEVGDGDIAMEDATLDEDPPSSTTLSDEEDYDDDDDDYNATTGESHTETTNKPST